MRRSLIVGPACAVLLSVPAVALAHGGGHHNAPATAPTPVATVVSFAGGALTLKLADDSSLAAKVDDTTRIRCTSPTTTTTTTTTPTTTTTTPTTTTASTRHHGDDDNPAGEQGKRGDERRSKRRGHGHAWGWRLKRCSTADLTAGTAVDEAVVIATSTGAVYRKVDLIK